MRLWALIGRRGFLETAVNRVNKIVPLGFSLDTIALMQARIEPLGTIRHACLVQNTIDQFLIKNLGVLGARKIAVALAPQPPAVGQAVCYLSDRSFAARGAVLLGYAGLAKVFLG